MVGGEIQVTATQKNCKYFQSRGCKKKKRTDPPLGNLRWSCFTVEVDIGGDGGWWLYGAWLIAVRVGEERRNGEI